MKAIKYTKEKLSEAIESSVSCREAMMKLGIKPYGGNYKTIKKYIKKFNIDTSHFLEKRANLGKIFKERRKSIKEYLILGTEIKITSNDLKKRLIIEGIFEHKCYECGLEKWNNFLIPIDLHHIDGNHYNNQIENLTILCPNCHRQKHTKNNKKELNRCKCGIIISDKVKRCQKCHIKYFKTQSAYKQRKVKDRPDLKTLEQQVNSIGHRATGKVYGVSDNAIRKWIKQYKEKI
jgi:hypothetical protein